MPSPSTQLAFDLRLPAGRPLVPMEALMVLLDQDYDDVVNLVELGKLAAWDIASPGAERRDIRVWRDSVIAYGRSRSDETLTAPDPAAILPQPTMVAGQATIRGRELERRFSCSQWLIGNLLTTGELKPAPIAVGPKISPYILHSSAVEFLAKRRL